MKLQIKSKLFLGLAFLFAVIVLTGLVGLFAINRLADDSKNILKANYESLVYAKNMQSDIDNFAGRISPEKSNDTTVINDFERNLEAQEKNITELGERGA